MKAKWLIYHGNFYFDDYPTKEFLAKFKAVGFVQIQMAYEMMNRP